MIGLFLILRNHDTVTVKKSDWLKDFINYLQNYNKTYQTLILIDQENKFSKVNEIVTKISRHIPSLMISFQKVRKEEKFDLSKSQSPKNAETRMIDIIHVSEVSEDETQLNPMIDFASRISGVKTRPKCLIILPQEGNSFSYRKLLQNMWAKRFLDVTILELLELKNPKEKNFLKLPEHSKTALIHQYNPFTKTYYRFQFSKSVSWFPDKTRNLQGFEMKVGLIHVPPFAYLEHNSKGELIKSSGMDVMLTKELSKAMNFRIVWDASDNEDDWGSSEGCTKERSTGLISKLMNNELDFIGFENGRYGACYESLYEHSRSTKFARVSLVVPILLQKSDLVLTNWDILNTLGLVGTLLVTWFTSYLLLSKPQSLNLLQVTSIVLGIPTPNEPSKSAERIVFGCMLVSCLLHSSFIYSVFTKVNLQIDRKPEIETIKDIVASELTPIVGRNYYSAFYHFTEGDTRLLLEKSHTELETVNCLKMLLDKKNVVCVTRVEVANLMIENYKDSCGQPVMKILKEVLRSTVSGMNMAAGSPFVEHFDEIIQRFIESGVVEKFQQSGFNRSSVVINGDESCLERGSETAQLKKQILYLFLFGYACATAAFFGEIIFAYFMK